MNTKRIVFWVLFVIVLGLIIWGMAAALNKQQATGQLGVGTPPDISAADHVRGPANAKVTLIEYSDFQCPACEAYYPVVEQVLASSTVPIRMAYRHFPLPQHANAKPSARASEAAALQGKFWEMYKLLFANHAEWTELADPTQVFVGYAQRIGLDVDTFKADMGSDAVKKSVDDALAASEKLGLNQTPTFFLNGKLIQNPRSYDEFNADIQAAAR